MKKIIILAFVLFTSGCASKAGPFVTGISSDGNGAIIVEKCMARFDPWMAVVNNDDCTTSTIRLK
ncbi:MAG: hypothetical protein IPM37_21665 [Hahellaceae bacterium]|nr:hypothetical protein [Hahellaceae bacterium]